MIVSPMLNTALSKSHLMEFIDYFSLISAKTQNQIKILINQRLHEQWHWDLLKKVCKVKIALDYRDFEPTLV